MGYSKNKKTLESRLSWLGPILEGRSTEWTVTIGEEESHAYKVRECFYIARLFPLDFPELASIADHFKVEVVSPGHVQAVPTANSTDVGILARPVAAIVRQGLDNAHPEQFAGPKTAESIVALWLRHQPSNDPMHFPQANLNEDELRTLHAWASKPDRNMLLFVHEGAVTLRHFSLDLADAAFNPAIDL